MKPVRLVWLVTAFLCALGVSTRAGAVALTPAEQAWVQAHPQVRVGLKAANAPFSVVTTEGFEGIAPDMLNRVAAETGLHVSLERLPTTANAADVLQQRQVDVLVGLNESSVEQGVTLTQPYLSFPAVVIGRADDSFLALPLASAKRSIALAQSLAEVAWKMELPSHDVRFVNTTAAALTELQLGHVDLAIADLAAASYEIKSHDLSNLKLVGFLDYRSERRLAVRGDWPELVGIINKALGSISESDKEQWARPWLDASHARSASWRPVLGFLALGLALLGLGVWLALAYRRRIERLLTERGRLQSELLSISQRATSLHGEKTEVLRLALQHFDRPLVDLASVTERLCRLPLSDADVQTNAVEISSQVARMRQALDVLREMQSLAENNRRLAITAVNVGAVVKEAVSNVEGGAAKRNVRISAPAPAKTWFVSADDDSLRKVIESLISHGVKASPSGSAVSLALWQAETRVLLTISDEGPGLPISDQGELFRRPGQTSSPLEGNEKSADYGLGLVHNLVIAMGGWLWCDSELGRGTTFVVELPLALSWKSEQMLAPTEKIGRLTATPRKPQLQTS